jgi:hypothetical protein
MIRHTLPFRSQSWDLTQWERLGFSSETEANYWQDSSCGVLCLGMILDAVSQTAPSTKELIDRGISFKAYTDNTGWSHEGLAALAQSYGLSATKKEPITPTAIKQLLQEELVFIASIRWAFTPEHSLLHRLGLKKQRGGHLALVTGFDDSGFFVHHTSIRPEYNWQNHHISYEQFAGGFTSRGVIVSLSKI